MKELCAGVQKSFCLFITVKSCPKSHLHVVLLFIIIVVAVLVSFNEPRDSIRIPQLDGAA